MCIFTTAEGESSAEILNAAQILLRLRLLSVALRLILQALAAPKLLLSTKTLTCLPAARHYGTLPFVFSIPIEKMRG